MFKSLVGLHLGKDPRRKRDSNPGLRSRGGHVTTGAVWDSGTGALQTLGLFLSDTK